MEGITEKIANRLPSKGMTTLPSIFAGCYIEERGGVLQLQQEDYARTIARLPSESGFEDFRRLRHRLAWTALTRPDILAAVKMLAQVTSKTVTPSNVKTIKKTVTQARKFAHCGLSYPPVDLESLHMVAFSDASFAGNEDSSSQLGFIVHLVDASGHACVLSFDSRKSRRVVRSILGAEIFAFAEGVDEALLLRHDLTIILGRGWPSKALTDSPSLFRIIIK